MGKIMRNGIPYVRSKPNASSLVYDNSNSNMSATNAQAVLDELYARLAAINVTEYCPVTYLVDSGNEYTEDIEVGTSCLAPTTFVPELDGYTFKGWREDNVASGDVLTDKMIDSEEPITLYAVFEKVITLTYDGNGATGGSTSSPDPVHIYYNNGNKTEAEFTLAANGFTKTDYNFSGWDLGAAGTTIKLSESATAKAQWTIVSSKTVYTATHTNATNSSEVTTSVTKRDTTHVTSITNPVMSDYATNTTKTKTATITINRGVFTKAEIAYQLFHYNNSSNRYNKATLSGTGVSASWRDEQGNSNWPAFTTKNTVTLTGNSLTITVESKSSSSSAGTKAAVCISSIVLKP